jgi:hypothetical protein
MDLSAYAGLLEQRMREVGDAGAAAFRAQDMTAVAQASGRLAELQDLQRQMRSLQQRWREVIGDDDDVDDATEPEPEKIQPGELAPMEAYIRPLLQTLVEFGGSGESRVITEEVGRKLVGVLTAKDYATIPSGLIRWWNRLKWTRVNLISAGLMLPRSRTGIWEISEAGRRRLAEPE